MALLRGQYAQARPSLEESAAICRTLDDKVGLLLTLNDLGEAVRYAGDYATAVTCYEESLHLSRAVGDNHHNIMVIHNLGHALCSLGDYERALALFKEGLVLSGELGVRAIILFYLMGVASVLGMQEQTLAAAQLFGAAEALLHAMGVVIGPLDRAECNRYIAAVRSQLDPAAFADAWANGRTMTMDQAIAYALRIGD